MKRGIQGYNKNSGKLGYRDAWKMEYRGTEIEGYSDTIKHARSHGYFFYIK